MVAGRTNEREIEGFSSVKGKRKLLGVMGYPLSGIVVLAWGSTHMSRLVKWYTLNMLGLLYINYTSIKMAKNQACTWYGGQVNWPQHVAEQYY